MVAVTDAKSCYPMTPLSLSLCAGGWPYSSTSYSLDSLGDSVGVRLSGKRASCDEI